jgi:hypothetical protein
MKHSESIAAIAEALAAAQAEYVPVKKTKEATVKGVSKQGKAYEYTYMYADLADILSMLLPRLSKQGIALSQPNVLVDGKLRVVTYLLHKTGEWMHSDGIEMSEEGDPQQFGIESTYFRRYDVASFTGVAPDEDTDAQGAGNRTKRTTPAQAMEGARSHQQNTPRPASTQQSTQQVNQRAAAPQEAAQPQGAQCKFIPPDGLTTVIKGVKEIAAQEANGDQRARKGYLMVTFLGQHHGLNFASCFDTKYWDLLKESIGLECHFQIKEAEKNNQHFINIVDIIYIDGQEYKDGAPVLQGDAQ